MKHYTINLKHAANADDVAAAIALETPDTHEQPITKQIDSNLVLLTAKGSASVCAGLGTLKQTLIITYSNQRIVSMSYAFNVEIKQC